MRRTAASPPQPERASQRPAPAVHAPAELGDCSEAAAAGGSRCDAAVQTAAEPLAADAQAIWARVAATVAQDPRVLSSLQASLSELASGAAGGAHALAEGSRVEASAAFTAALAAALADSAAAADSFGLAPETADAPRMGRLRRGPLAQHSNSEPAATQPPPTKLRLRWTPELAAAFETAVAALGGLQYAAPQQILSRMREAGDAPSELNLAHLKSHLQKSRLADGRRRAAAAAAAAAAGEAPPEEADAGGGAGGIALLLRLAAASHGPVRAAAAPDQAMPPAKAARRR